MLTCIFALVLIVGPTGSHEYGLSPKDSGAWPPPCRAHVVHTPNYFSLRVDRTVVRFPIPLEEGIYQMVYLWGESLVMVRRVDGSGPYFRTIEKVSLEKEMEELQKIPWPKPKDKIT